MKPFPHTPELLRAAKRIVWFKPPKESLENPVELMAYAMKHSTDEDMALLLEHVGESGLQEAIDNAPAGIIDARSWSIGTRGWAGIRRRRRRNATCGDREEKGYGGACRTRFWKRAASPSASAATSPSTP